MQVKGKYEVAEFGELGEDNDAVIQFRVLKIKDELNCVDVKRMHGRSKVFIASFKAFQNFLKIFTEL